MSENISINSEKKDGEFSYFHNGIKQVTNSSNMNLKELFEIILSDAFSPLISRIRTEKDISQQKELKNGLPYVTFSGTFSHRSIKGFNYPSGSLCVDIDNIPEVKKVKKELQKSKYIALMYISPRGNGLKVIFKIPLCNQNEEHKQRYRAIITYLTKEFGIKDSYFDKGACDISRACFISHDTEAYINEKAEIFEDIITEDAKMNYETYETTITPRKCDDNIIEIIESDYTLKSLYYNESTERFESRSEAEMSLVCRLIKCGVTNFEDIDRTMNRCQIGKWQESHDSYRKLTFNNALKLLNPSGDQNKIQIKLPTNGSFSNFALKIAQNICKNSSKIFYRPRTACVVEISQWYDKIAKNDVTGIKEVKATRLINILDETFYFFNSSDSHNAPYRHFKSLNKNQAELLLASDIFLNALPKIDRFLTSPMPFIIEGELCLPKMGWDERLDSFLSHNAPEIIKLTISDAKEIIYEIYREFCFKTPRDKILAIAHLFTPGCRGLYYSINARTPVFLYSANRERAGKDYCAGIVLIVYEGLACDNPPISSDDRTTGASEELRKKLTSAMKQGRRMMHFANNRGNLSNVVFEQALTSEHWNDRELGKNTEITINNEMDFSLSANLGLKYTPDFWHRSRQIELFFAPEDINKRTFTKTDLHGWIKKNRSKILSAIFTLIEAWFDNGQPTGEIFTSFPEWARVVGGILKYHGFGDPCLIIEDNDAIGGDIETKNIRNCWKYMAENNLNVPLRMSEIIDIIFKAQLGGEELFPYYNNDDRSARTSLSKKIRKYIGREFSGVILKIHQPNETKSKEKYIYITSETTNCDNINNLDNLNIIDLHDP